MTSAMGTIIIAMRNKPRRRRRIQPKFRRAALVKSLSSPLGTAWRCILSCGGPGDFIVPVNFPKRLILEPIFPLFEKQRAKLSFGSSYRNGPKKAGRRAQVDSVDLIGLALWYLKSRDPIFKLCLAQRKRLLRIVCHIFNFRTRFVGLNQIRTTYSGDRNAVQPWLQEYIVDSESETEWVEWFLLNLRVGTKHLISKFCPCSTGAIFGELSR